MELDFKIRLMERKEKKAVKELMKRSFPFLARLFFTITPHTLVADRKGELLGGIVLSIFPLENGLGGLVGWIFTSPSSRKMGIGQALLDEALEYFSKRGVTQVFACIEGYNTSSSKIFKGTGFSYLPPLAQIREFGLKTPFVLYHCQHLMDLGHFLWVKPVKDVKERGSFQWIANYFINSLLLLMALFRLSNLDSTHLHIVPLTFLLFFSLRDRAMVLIGKRYQLSTSFRMWETGLTLVMGLSLLFGGFFPVPGSRYPNQENCRCEDLRPALAYMGLAGTLSTIGTTYLLGFLGQANLLPPFLLGFLPMALSIGKTLSLMDTLPIFFPVSSFNGRRVFDFNKSLWVLLCILSLLTLFL